MEKTLSTLEIPSKWSPKYYLKRIGEKSLVIDRKTRDAIVKALSNDGRYVQVGEYTIMLRTIKEISPVWGNDNIPPRPSESTQTIGVSEDNRSMKVIVTNKEEIAEWDRLFGNHD